jgi:tetratricopeptide (TPR) repeat protein
MRSITQIAALSALAMALSACTGSKPLSNRAAKLDQAGLYAEAAEMYLQAVQRNQRNVDAKIGLRKTGQQLLDDRLATFFREVNMGNDKAAAVAAFLEAQSYQQRVQRMGVMLEIPDHYRTDFERVKGDHLVELYDEGQDLLAQQDFRSAELVFAKIAKLEPNYKDASSLQRVAFLEPLYQAGKADLANGRFRQAFDELDRVVKKDPSYKDASALRQEALNKGQYSVAVLPFTGNRGDRASMVQAHAMTALTNTGDPFLRIVDRENMDRILEEQRLGLSGVVDEQTAVRVGNLMGAQAVLMGTLIEYREDPGQLRRSTKQAFESYAVQLVNKETGEKYTETRYRPAQYTEYFQENKVYLSFSYRLVSLETGEVLMSKVEDREVKDHVYYATSQGNADNLWPARNGVVDLRAGARRDLRSLFSAPREIKSVSALGNDAVRTATGNMAGSIQQVIASRTP